MIMTSALRLYLGGTGAWAGVGLIFTAGAIGVAWRHFRKRDLDDISVKELYSAKQNTPQLAAWVPRLSKTRPEGAKFCNTPSACGGDRNFEGFANLFFLVRLGGLCLT